VEWIAVLVVGLVAGTLGGIVGFGTSIMLLPLLVIIFGPLEAVPMMAITALMANLSRVLVWWREVNWKVCAVYGSTGIPGAALGAVTLLSLSSRVIELALGTFFLAMVPARRWLQGQGFTMRLWHMAIVGGVIGFLTGLVVSTGPINTPFFLAYGLVKGAFLSTEAMASLLVYGSKAAVFQQLGALTWPILWKGLIVGSSVMAGSVLAKGFVLRMQAEQFRILMDALILLAGVTLLATALFQ